jgi:hypothetical protein
VSQRIQGDHMVLVWDDVLEVPDDAQGELDGLVNALVAAGAEVGSPP